jgi:hypothetical protein
MAEVGMRDLSDSNRLTFFMIGGMEAEEVESM